MSQISRAHVVCLKKFIFFYRYYIIFIMIFPSLFYIPKFFEYENVNVYKNYTLVRPCQFPIDFAICRPVVLKNNSDLSNVTNDISNVTNTKRTCRFYNVLQEKYLLNIIVLNRCPFSSRNKLNI